MFSITIVRLGEACRSHLPYMRRVRRPWPARSRSSQIAPHGAPVPSRTRTSLARRPRIRAAPSGDHSVRWPGRRVAACLTEGSNRCGPGLWTGSIVHGPSGKRSSRSSTSTWRSFGPGTSSLRWSPPPLRTNSASGVPVSPDAGWNGPHGRSCQTVPGRSEAASPSWWGPPAGGWRRAPVPSSGSRSRVAEQEDAG